MRAPDRPLAHLRRQNRDTAVPAVAPREPAAAADGTSSELALTFDDNRLTSIVFGQYDQNIAKLERRLGVTTTANGNHVSIKGPPEACDHARRVLEMLYNQVRQGRRLELGDIDGAIEETTYQGLLFPKESEIDRPGGFVEIRTRKRGVVRARTATQDAYLRALNSHELVFAEGPAGTGQDVARGRLRHHAARTGRCRAADPVASRRRGRRAARLPAGRHAREDRPLPAPGLRRAA